MRRFFAVLLAALITVCNLYVVAFAENDTPFIINNEGVLVKYRDYKDDGDGNIVIPDEVKEIGDGVFSGFESIKSVTIPNGVTIGRGAFSGCTGLTELTIPDGVTIEKGAFSGCTGLTELTIPDGLTIKSWTFSGCTGLTELIIPEDVTIESEAFSGCTELKSVTFNGCFFDTGTIAEIFYECSALTEIIIAGNIDNWNLSEELSTGILETVTKVTISDGVTKIPDEAFKNYVNLKEINIPDSVTSIGKNSFEGCESLEALTLHSGIMKIGTDAFLGCEDLTVSCVEDSTAHIYAVSNGIYCNIIAEEVSTESSGTVGTNKTADDGTEDTSENGGGASLWIGIGTAVAVVAVAGFVVFKKFKKK